MGDGANDSSAHGAMSKWILESKCTLLCLQVDLTLEVLVTGDLDTHLFYSGANENHWKAIFIESKGGMRAPI